MFIKTRHVRIGNTVAERAARVLETLGYPQERIELARIAGYLQIQQMIQWIIGR